MIRNQYFQANLLRVIILSLLLSSCGNRVTTPTATPAFLPTLANFQELTLVPTTALSSSSPTNTPILLTETASPTFTPNASPTPSCGAPASWVLYTIRPGDNLFRLSLKTGTTVEDVMLANCLPGEAINAGDQLYLPFIPPVDTPVPPLPPPTADLCLNILNCSNSSLPSLTIGVGGGNYPTFRACTSGASGPRVEFDGLSVTPADMNREIGDQAYFFACGFTNPSQLTAHIAGPGVSMDLNVLDINLLPNRDLLSNNGGAQKVIPWYPTCDLPAGSYTITLSDGVDQRSLPAPINLTQPRLPRIMVRPQTIRGGQSFDIFYCGYSSVASQPVQFDLFYQTSVAADGQRNFAHLRSWSVLMNSSGWAQQAQSASFNAAANTYYIQDNTGALDGEDLFWINP